MNKSELIMPVFVLCVVIAITVGIVSIVKVSTDSYTKRMQYYVEHGYCETVVPGKSETMMQKCE